MYVKTPIKKLYIHLVGYIKLSNELKPMLFNTKIESEMKIRAIKKNNFLLEIKTNNPNIS